MIDKAALADNLIRLINVSPESPRNLQKRRSHKPGVKKSHEQQALNGII